MELPEKCRVIPMRTRGKSKVQTTRGLRTLRLATGTGALKTPAVGEAVEMAAAESEERHLALIECAADGVVMVENGIHVYANRRFLDIFGYDDQQEIVGKPLESLVYPEDLERIANYIGRRRKGETASQVYEFRGIRKDGAIIYLEGSDTGIAFHGRAVAMCFIRDITHRKETEEAIRRLNSELELRIREGTARLESTNRLLEQEIVERKSAEAALRASEVRYRAIVQDQSELICRFFPDTTLTFVNEAFCRFFGVTHDELVGRSFVPLMSDKSEKGMAGVDPADFIPRGLIWSAETTATRLDGQRRWLQWTGRAIRDSEGRAVEFQGVGRDITEAKLAEEKRKVTEIALRESEEKFRVLTENTAAGIVIYRNNRLLYTNPAMSSITGFTREELAKMTVLDTVHPDLREEARIWSRAVARGEKVSTKGESKTATKSGEDRWVDVTMGSAVIDNQPALIATLIDVTARKIVEDALRQRVKDIEKLYETSQVLLQHIELEKIYGEICRIGAEQFGLAMVWIGLLDKGDARVRPVAFYGGCNGCFSGDPISSDDGLVGRGPVRRAVISMQPSVTNSVKASRHFEPWRKATIERGYRSFAAFPLIYDKEVFGVVACYADHEGHFTEDHLHLYQSFTNLAANAIADARLLSSLSRQRDEIRAMASRLADVGESERKQLARELHDRVGQNLTALSINLNILRGESDAAVPGDSRLDDSLSLLNDMSDTIRNVMGQLRPSLLDEYGLLAALREHCNRFSRRFGIEAEVQGDGVATGLPASSETSMFRIAQEALNNVAKHARAGKVIVTLQGDVSAVRMAIADDGDGFLVERVVDPGPKRGWGLTTMAERAEAIGGLFRIESMPGHGTLVTVEVLR
jgi:PAS domain S-box-containing protein